MSERFAEALEELRWLANEMRERAEDTHYGYFIGGDPNVFMPDPECSTEEERVRHKEAYKSWNERSENPHPAPHCATLNEDKYVPGFGLGTMVLVDETARDWAERLERCIARLESE